MDFSRMHQMSSSVICEELYKELSDVLYHNDGLFGGVIAARNT